jgi:hypothetical protein
MTTTAQATKTTFMLMADILALISVDAEAELEYRAEGFGHRSGLPLNGTTVADILPHKVWDIEHDAQRYGALRASMMAHGQTAPIAVRAGYLLNGGHRVAMALELGWPGLDTTPEFESSEDRAWNDANPRCI